MANPFGTIFVGLGQGIWNFVFWITIAMIFAFAFVGILYWKKNSRFSIPVEIHIDLGAGKSSISHCKAGWFKTKTGLMGLIDYGGEYRLLTKEKGNFFNTINRVILCPSSIDFHELDGRRGLVVTRKPDDNEILVPINKITITNKEAMMEIPPASFRDEATKDVSDTERELQEGWEKALHYAALILPAMFLMICVLFIIQFANHQLDKSYELARFVSQNAGVTLPSGAP